MYELPHAGLDGPKKLQNPELGKFIAVIGQLVHWWQCQTVYMQNNCRRYGKGTLMTFADDEVMKATTGVLPRVAYELK